RVDVRRIVFLHRLVYGRGDRPYVLVRYAWGDGFPVLRRRSRARLALAGYHMVDWRGPDDRSAHDDERLAATGAGPGGVLLRRGGPGALPVQPPQGPARAGARAGVGGARHAADAGRGCREHDRR